MITRFQFDRRPLLVKVVGVTLSVVVASACSDSAESPPTGHPRFVSTVLPNGAGDGECGVEKGNAPALCDWIHSIDGLVVGEIVGIEAVYGPSIPNRDPVVIQGSCGGNLAAAAAVRLRPVQWLSGAPADPEAEVLVHIGERLLADWGAVVDDSGDTTTLAASGALDGPAILPIGSVIAAPLMRVEAPMLESKFVGADGRIWTVGGEHFFTFDEAGTIRNPQNVTNCGSPSQPDMEGWAYETFTVSVDQCADQVSSEAAVADNTRKSGYFPGAQYAGFCHGAAAPPPSRSCTETSPCPMGYCENGNCECHGAEICQSWWGAYGF